MTSEQVIDYNHKALLKEITKGQMIYNIAGEKNHPDTINIAAQRSIMDERGEEVRIVKAEIEVDNDDFDTNTPVPDDMDDAVRDDTDDAGRARRLLLHESGYDSDKDAQRLLKHSG